MYDVSEPTTKLAERITPQSITVANVVSSVIDASCTEPTLLVILELNVLGNNQVFCHTFQLSHVATSCHPYLPSASNVIELVAVVS